MQREALLRRVIVAGFIGTVIEWYDYALYGAAAALIFSHLFFPSFSTFAGTLASFATYGVGFLIRPLGGVIFGNLGDKVGRKPILVLTLLLMGFATALVGVLPTYAVIGAWAPVLLVVSRMLQGLGSGAEFGGAAVMTAEYSPRGRRGLYTSFLSLGYLVGTLLASGTFALLTLFLSDRDFLGWAWRLPFLFSFVLVIIGLYVRLRINESRAFVELKQGEGSARVPVLRVVRTQLKSFLIVMGCRADGTCTYVFQTFALAYIATGLGLGKGVALTGVTIASIVGIVTIPAAGALSDKFGRRPIYMGAAIYLIVIAFPFFWLIDTRSPGLIILALTLGISGATMPMLAIQGSLFSELFDTPVRFSGFAVARECSSPLTGGIAPIIATALLAASGGGTWAVSLYMIAMLLVTVVALSFAPETYRDDLNAVRFGQPEKMASTDQVVVE